MKNVSRIFSKGMLGIYTVLLIMINVVVLFLQWKTEYSCKKEFDFPDIVLLCMGLLLLAGFLLWYRRKREALEQALSKRKWLIAVLTAGLLVLQILFCYNLFFITGWDAWNVVKNAERISNLDYLGLDIRYFSSHSNNLFLLCMYSYVFKIAHIFGKITWEEGVFAVVIFQCVVSAATGFFLYQVVLKRFRSYADALLAWVIYVVFVGFSPWLFITYSDSVGLFVPILLVWLYQIQQNGKHRWIIWFFIGVSAYVGYRVKPQTAIVFIAMALVEIFCNQRISGNPKKKLGSFAACALAVVIAFAGGTVFYQKFVVPKVHMTLDAEADFGIDHFLMLGLHEESNGVYSAEDSKFSMSFETKAERDAADLEVAKERLKEMWGSRLLSHLEKKTLVNFADGTFAWSEEGGFYKTVLKEPNETVSPFLRSIYYEDETYYTAFVNVMQMIWLLLLFGMAAAGMGQARRLASDKTLLVLLVAVIGLILFQTIFEARARYLYTFASLFILLAMTGFRNMEKKLC